jgi:hypothetical protein
MGSRPGKQTGLGWYGPVSRRHGVPAGDTSTETKIARVATGSAAPRRAELGRADPILIPRGGPRPWEAYQQNAGNRCAHRRLCRSSSTVAAEVMCSHRVQLCALVLHRDPALLGPPLPCYSTPRTRFTRRATASRRRAVCRARSEGSSPRPVPRGRCRCTRATVGGVGRGSARPAV